MLVEAYPVGLYKDSPEAVGSVDLLVVSVGHLDVPQGVIEDALPLVVELIFVVDDDFFFVVGICGSFSHGTHDLGKQS